MSLNARLKRLEAATPAAARDPRPMSDEFWEYIWGERELEDIPDPAERESMRRAAEEAAKEALEPCPIDALIREAGRPLGAPS